MLKRKIVKIDEELCNGCGICIPACPEGAIKVIDGKARLVSDLFCDGLGACLGECPVGAITIEEREAKAYNESKVMEQIVKAGPNTIKEHLNHLKDHNEVEYLNEALEYLKKNDIENPLDGLDDCQETNKVCGCPGAGMQDFRDKKVEKADDNSNIKHQSELRQWPIQLMLVPPTAPYFKDADLVIAADCVPFAYADFHQDFLKDKIVAIGCPKLDDIQHYQEKIAEIIKLNDLKSITVVHMEVPCCFSLKQVVEVAINSAGKNLELKCQVISIQGEKK